MTVSISLNGDRLLSWDANAEDAEQLDAAIKEMAQDSDVTPEQIARSGAQPLLSHGRGGIEQSPDGVWRSMALMWLLLSHPTGNPDHPGLFRDYVEVWDFDFDIDATDLEQVSIRVGASMQGGGQWKGLN